MKPLHKWLRVLGCGGSCACSCGMQAVRTGCAALDWTGGEYHTLWLERDSQGLILLAEGWYSSECRPSSVGREGASAQQDQRGHGWGDKRAAVSDKHQCGGFKQKYAKANWRTSWRTSGEQRGEHPWADPSPCRDVMERWRPAEMPEEVPSPAEGSGSRNTQ